MRVPEEDLYRHWPSGPQAELLEIILSDEPVADRWDGWQARYPIRDTDAYRLVPALYRRLQQDGIVPGAYLKGVARHCYASGVVQRQAAYEMVGRLAAAEIPCLAMKGLALSTLLGYTPRHMGDVDLLVPKDRVKEALQITLAAGWIPNTGMNIHDLLRTMRFTHAADFTRAGLRLDLHWHTAHQDRSTTFDLPVWGRSSLKGVLTIPSRTDLLFQTMLHGLRHDASAHAWPVDLFNIVKASDEPLDWQTLMTVATSRRLMVQLNVLVTALDHYVPGTVPAGVRERVQTEDVSHLELLEHRGITSRTPSQEEWQAVLRLAFRRQNETGHLRAQQGRLFT